MLIGIITVFKEVWFIGLVLDIREIWLSGHFYQVQGALLISDNTQSRRITTRDMESTVRPPEGPGAQHLEDKFDLNILSNVCIINFDFVSAKFIICLKINLNMFY